MPIETPLTLFILAQIDILPVRITEFSITEEAFDTSLNPIRAKVSLGMRVLSVDDLGFNQKGGNLFMRYLQQKEQIAARALPALSTFSASGVFHDGCASSIAGSAATGRIARHSVSADQPLSRYRDGAICKPPTARTVIFISRRFLPPPESFALLQEHVVTQGERLDNITASYIGRS